MENEHIENHASDVLPENTATPENAECIEPVPTCEQPEEEQVSVADSQPVTAPKKKWYRIVIAAVALIVTVSLICVIFAAATNSYRTPINLMMRYYNAEELDNPTKFLVNLTNGFCDKELNALIRLMSESSYYDDIIDDTQDQFEDMVDAISDEFGDNYRITYKIQDKEELDKSDLKDARNHLRTWARILKDRAERYEDFSSDDWKDLAEELDISRSDAKKIPKYLENLYEELRSAEVTQGYELDIIIRINGDDYDEEEITLNVYKINGRWMADEFISEAFRIIPLY